jgi:hypothetical protein
VTDRWQPGDFAVRVGSGRVVHRVERVARDMYATSDTQWYAWSRCGKRLAAGWTPKVGSWSDKRECEVCKARQHERKWRP